MNGPASQHPPSVRKPLSLRRKSSARLAAVQCLYQMHLADAPPSAVQIIARYSAHVAQSGASGDRDLKPDEPPSQALLTRIIEGVCEHRGAIDDALRRQLLETRKVERLGPLLHAILQAAWFEMHYTDAQAATIVSEYVALTDRFFDDPERGFVNAFLDGAAKGGHGAA